MSVHINGPVFQLQRATPTIPQSILGSLMPNEESCEFSPRRSPWVMALHEAAAGAALDRKAIFARLEPNKNVAKAYRIIDAVLDGADQRPESVIRVAKALALDGEKIAGIEAAQSEWQARRWRARVHRHCHQVYRKFGPYLYPMPLKAWRPSLLSLTGDGYLYVQVSHSVENGALVTPGLDDIARAIQTPPEWFNKHPRSAFGAYLYHRLPDEMAFFDLQGNLISHGDCHLEYPEGVKRFIF